MKNNVATLFLPASRKENYQRNIEFSCYTAVSADIQGSFCIKLPEKYIIQFMRRAKPSQVRENINEIVETFCLPQVCDGVADCPEGEDEAGSLCSRWRCEGDSVRCQEDNICISPPSSALCSGLYLSIIYLLSGGVRLKD